MIGLVIGMTRFIWQFSYNDPPCGTVDNRPALIAKVHYLHFSIILFVITCVCSYCISLLTPPIPEKYVIDSKLDKFFKFFICLVILVEKINVLRLR